MKKLINVISTRLSLTRAEVIIISSLLAFAISGYLIKSYKPYSEAQKLIQQKEKEYFTGSQADSIFNAEQKRHQKYVDLVFNENEFQTLSDNKSKGFIELSLNLNKATYTELLEIPGIGPVMADRLIRFRAYKGGRISSLNELLEIKGITQKRLEQLNEYLIIE